MVADSKDQSGDAGRPEGANAWWFAACCAGLAAASAFFYLARESDHADLVSAQAARLSVQDERLREQAWEIEMLRGSIEDLNSEFAARLVALERREADRKLARHAERVAALKREGQRRRAPAPSGSAEPQESTGGAERLAAERGSSEASGTENSGTPSATVAATTGDAPRATTPDSPSATAVAATEQPGAETPEPSRRMASAPTRSLPSRVGPESDRIQRLEEAIPVQSGGVLLPKGNLQLEPQLSFTTSSVNRVEIMGYTILPALTLGVIDVTRRETTSLSGILTARYGLTNHIELDASIPMIGSWSRFRLSPTNTDALRGSNINAKGYGFGDLRVGARYQLNRGDPSTPVFVGGLGLRVPTGKSPYAVDRYSGDQQFLEKELPTGSGFFGLSGTLSFVYPNEPGVLFGNLRYTWNIPSVVNETQPGSEEDASYGKIDPGDVIGGSMGLGLAINDRVSLSLSYDHAYVLKTRQNGEFVDGSVPLQIGTLGAGLTWRRSRRSSYSFFLGVGVTDDAPDVSLGIRIPTSYDLFRD